MKFSSISLIAAALSAIAGSTIAAPVPLWARALEQVNSFERDLDVYPPSRKSVAILERNVDAEPVDLFTRFTGKLPHQKHHNDLANEIEESAAHARKGYALAKLAGSMGSSHEKARWKGVADELERKAEVLAMMKTIHQHLGSQPHETSLYQDIVSDRRFADDARQRANEAIEAARPLVGVAAGHRFVRTDVPH